MDDKLFAAMISGAVGLAGIIVTSVFSVLNYFQSREKAKIDRAAERRKVIAAALADFYGPFLYYLDVARALYTPFRANKPKGFRTLTYLLNPEQTYEVAGCTQRVTLSQSDHALLKRIIETEDKMEELIRVKGGLVDDPVLLSDYVPDHGRTDIPQEQLKKIGLLGLAITHCRVLKMAYMGEIKGEPEKYEHLVYPRALDDYIKRKINDLQRQLKELP
jgi:hypothetical protein